MSVDTNVKLTTLIDITGDFSKKHEVVGRTERSGRSYGKVYKGLYKDEVIAMKRIDPEIKLDDENLKTELLKLGNVQHENVVKLVGFCRGSRSHFIEHGGRMFWKPLKERILCFEFMPGGSLDDHIADDSKDLDWATCYKIIKGTCEGINCLHTTFSKNSILFQNIKPSNILLDKNSTAKVDGLNLSGFKSKAIEEGEHQIFEDCGHSSAYNVHSLGDLILRLMDGRSWYDRYCEMSNNEKFAGHVHEKWKKKSMEKSGYELQEKDRLQVKKCVILALNCVQSDRNKRPSTKLIVDELDQVPSKLDFPGKPPTSGPRRKQHVVILYAFDCSSWTTAWCTVDRSIFWMVQESLTHCINSSLSYIYFMAQGNTYTKDAKLVDPDENKATGYKGSSEWARKTCTQKMQSGLKEANELIKHRGDQNSVILLFSDGLIHKEDFFDGAEEFVSEFPVHTFTLGGDEYNKGLCAIAKNSPGGKFHTKHVPERPMLSARFSRVLANIIHGTTFEDEESPSPSNSETQQRRLDVVLVYAFDCTTCTSTWTKMDVSIFWMVQNRLTRLEDSCMGYIYPMLSKNNYTSDMKVVDCADSKDCYTAFDWRRLPCTKNMASGLKEANKMLRNRDNKNGIILFFSDDDDRLINGTADFFAGTKTFISEFPVHTFTLGGDTYNEDLKAIADNSCGGKFHDIPIPDGPEESVPFGKILDSLLLGT